MFMDLLLLSFAGVTAKEYLSLLNKSWISPELKKKINYAGTLDRKKIIASLDRNNIGYLTHEHGLYPALLKEIYDFPYILYYRGNAALLKEEMLGVVGSRKATAYTRKSLELLLPSLKNIAIKTARGVREIFWYRRSLFCKKSLELLLPSLKNIAIISGLAYGADEAAHRTALLYNIKTIGVLAFGHNTHYPKTTADIRTEMEKNQLTISEDPPDTPMQKWQ